MGEPDKVLLTYIAGLKRAAQSYERLYAKARAKGDIAAMAQCSRLGVIIKRKIKVLEKAK